MNVLIISTNRTRQPVSVLPIGACIVADAGRQAGHNVRFLDLMFKDDPVAALGKVLHKFKPDVVGLSIRNIDNNDMRNPVTYFDDLPALSTMIKKNTNAYMVLGGAAMGIMPEELLNMTGGSWAVCGNGETVFPELLSLLDQEKSPRHLPGMAWIENRRLVKNPPAVSPISNACPTPDFYRWLDLDRYLSRLATIPIQTKRGCPFDCIYCTYAITEGRNHLLFSPESVVEAVKTYTSKGLRDIEFVDNVFNAPYDHALAICEGLARLASKPNLQTVELNPREVDDRLLSAMEAAGFVGVGITAESASDRVLAGLRKGFNADQVHRAADCIRRHKLPCIWIFMIGGPGETPATVQETLSFAKHKIRPNDVAFFNIGIRIYPGTELENIARKEGTLTAPPSEMLKPVFYLSPELNMEWLTWKVKHAMTRHFNFINSESLALPLVPKIYRLGYRLGIAQPVWRHTRKIRKGLRLLGMKV
jgi:radical SAM superfamily enzyme YgiQ (UPF0313 family)